LCEHDFVFAGAVQLYHGEELAGVVDVLRCTKCGANDIIVKKPGFDPTTGVGFLPTAPGQERYVLICREGESVDWQVVTLEVPSMFVHECVPAHRSMAVRVRPDLSIEKDGEVQHNLVPVMANVNRAVRLS
jgi:hypothetical protein